MKRLFVLVLTFCLMQSNIIKAEVTDIATLDNSLQDVPFWKHEGGWGLDELKNTNADCIWVVGEATGQAYGDASINNFADLSLYSKLYVTVTDGTPRILLNRDADEGQWNENEAESHLIDNTKGGWSARYFTSEAGENEGETVYIVDLKQINKDKGFAHLHAIKSGSWGATVTITSMTVEKQGERSYTFDFNAMDIATSSNDSDAGDITETLEMTQGDVTIQISSKDESERYNNRFWNTKNGPQLRMYSGTLTFEAPDGCKLVNIVFNNGKWNDGNIADSGVFEGSTWTGSAQKVVVSIAGNTQINNIICTIVGVGGFKSCPAPTFIREDNMLSITCSNSSASIYYTTDGSTPTKGSTKYTGPITLTQNCTVKAIAVADGYEDSEVATYEVDWIYLLGDVNDDGKVDVRDYIAVANDILGITQTGFNKKAADVTEDGVIDVTDYLGVGNIIHTGSPFGNSEASRNTKETTTN